MADTITNHWRRVLIVHDEEGRFVEMSGWRWYIIRNDKGEISRQFEGEAEVVTTSHEELKVLLGETMLKASEAAAIEKVKSAAVTAELDDHKRKLETLDLEHKELKAKMMGEATS